MSLNERAVISQWRRKVYAAFDCLCAEYGVTKIQTNRNSFIAVTGIHPKDEPDQVINMAFFATACQKKLRSFLPSMKLKTTNDNVLSMRFGIHTGTYSGKHAALESKSVVYYHNNIRNILHRASNMQK
jgi:hypothetical protein